MTKHSVDTAWIDTASALPAAGQPVQFVLHRQASPISGVYAADGFRSRWTHYASELVCKWRGLVDGADRVDGPHTEPGAARDPRAGMPASRVLGNTLLARSRTDRSSEND